MSNLNEFANLYLECGYSVVPLNKEKKPTMAWDRLKNQPLEPDEVDPSFKNAAMIGVLCGTASEGLYLIDFDGHQGQDVASVFRDFCKTNTYDFVLKKNGITVQRTPSGGFHIWFLSQEYDMKNEVLARYEDNHTMIETRGNGGYGIVVPSVGYDIIAGVELECLVQIPAEIAKALIDTAKSYDKGAMQPQAVDGTSNRLWPERWDAKTPEGKYNEECENEALNLLREAGWDIKPRKYDNSYLLLRPGKSWDEGASATYNYRPKMLFPFSTNALPFEANKAYSPFGIFTTLKHNGDYKAARIDLANRFGMLEPDKKVEVEIDPNKFPVDVFPQALMHVALEVSEKLSYHIDFVAASMLSAFGGVAGNKFKVRVAHGWNASPLFWFALVGSPGSKKSPPLKTMFEPIDSMDNQNVKIYQKEMFDYEAKPEGKRGKKPILKQVIVKDSTVEALQQAHGFNARGLIYYKDELISFFDDMSRYQAKDEAFWLTSFGNSSVKVQRKTSDMVFVENCHINVIGTIQPDVIRKLNQKKSDDGMFDRFLFTSANTKFEGIRIRKDPEVPMLKIWESIITKLSQRASYIDKDDTVIMPIPESCIEVYNAFADELEAIVEKEEKANANYYGKIQTYFPRFIITLALMDWMDSFNELEINASHIERAKRLCRYFMDTYKHLTSDMDAMAEVQDIVQQMRKKGKERNDIIIDLSIRGFKQKIIAASVGVNAATVSRVLKGVTNG